MYSPNTRQCPTPHRVSFHAPRSIGSHSTEHRIDICEGYTFISLFGELAPKVRKTTDGGATPGTMATTKLSPEGATEYLTCLITTCLCLCRPFRTFFTIVQLPGVNTQQSWFHTPRSIGLHSTEHRATLHGASGYTPRSIGLRSTEHRLTLHGASNRHLWDMLKHHRRQGTTALAIGCANAYDSPS